MGSLGSILFEDMVFHVKFYLLLQNRRINNKVEGNVQGSFFKENHKWEGMVS